MIGKKIEAAFNDQINAEMYSAYLYLAMAAQFDAMALEGFAGWMRAQAQEEMVHAMKFYDHVQERGGRVILQAIEAPPSEWDSPRAMFEDALAHEKVVTQRINDMADLADQEKDRPAANFLQWFIDEQVEEEKSAADVVQKLKRVEKAPGMLYMLDRELGQRAPTAPAAEGD